MNANDVSARGAIWLAALTRGAPLRPGFPPSVLVADAKLGRHQARYIAVVPDPANPYARARTGEVGLVEAWEIARAVRQVVDADPKRAEKRALVAVIDVTSQAYGRPAIQLSRARLLYIRCICSDPIEAEFYRRL